MTVPTPLPKRPKGRWFIGLLLLAGCAYAGYHVWDGFFRYTAYGTVTGRLVQLSPPWDGELAFLSVREGDRVRQGEVLATLENYELRQKLDQTDDELRVAQATLDAEAARLKWMAAFQVDQSGNAAARYLEAMGQLETERATLARLHNDWELATLLLRQKVISRQEVEKLSYEREGQAEKVAKLEKAVAEHKIRGNLSSALLTKEGDLGGTLSLDGGDQLKPHIARIAALHAERGRLEAKLARGRLKAPCNGLVIRVHRAVGERVKNGESIVAILEEGTLRVVLYMPQSASQNLDIGSEVDVCCDPYRQPLTCTVVRFAEQFEAAPEHLKRHYAAGQHLLPVYLEPAPETARWLALRIGGTIKLP